MTTAGKIGGATALAERCPRCGRRSETGETCSVCGSLLVEQAVRRFTPPVSLPLAEARTGGVLHTQNVTLAGPAASVVQAQPVARVVGVHLPANVVQGRVVVVSPATQEPMDFDPWRWVAIPAWGLLLLAGPTAAIIRVWQLGGFLPALGVAAFSFFVLRYLFSDRLLQGWQFTAALNGRYIVEPMPVVMLRLRKADDREIQLRLKGRIAGGAAVEGDRIRARGRWRRGVFHVKRIFCERTGAEMTPRQPSALLLAATGTIILAAIGCWLALTGFPWVGEQARAFHSSLSLPDALSEVRTTQFSP